VALVWSEELEAASEQLVAAYTALWNAVRGCGDETVKEGTLANLEAAHAHLAAVRKIGALRRRK
jgi:hypothetical protein